MLCVFGRRSTHEQEQHKMAFVNYRSDKKKLEHVEGSEAGEQQGKKQVSLKK